MLFQAAGGVLAGAVEEVAASVNTSDVNRRVKREKIVVSEKIIDASGKALTVVILVWYFIFFLSVLIAGEVFILFYFFIFKGSFLISTAVNLEILAFFFLITQLSLSKRKIYWVIAASSATCFEMCVALVRVFTGLREALGQVFWDRV